MMLQEDKAEQEQAALTFGTLQQCTAVQVVTACRQPEAGFGFLAVKDALSHEIC